MCPCVCLLKVKVYYFIEDVAVHTDIIKSTSSAGLQATGVSSRNRVVQNQKVVTHSMPWEMVMRAAE